MNSLVIGYGSIGQRHTKILSNLGFQVCVVTSNICSSFKSFRNIKEALDSYNPDYLIISNKTIDHYESLLNIINLCQNKKILVEKPLFEKFIEFPETNNIIKIGYNLRFHPIIKLLKKIIEGKKSKIISMNIYVGSYLPNWRTTSDYRQSYSSKKDEGGGVLRDLSHELDYIQLLAGKWDSLLALGGKYSNLEIDSDDLFKIFIQSEICKSISLELNYLDRNPKRYINLITNNLSIFADLIHGEVIINGEKSKYQIDNNYTYLEEHLNFIHNDGDELCNISDGIKLLKMIEAIEQSSIEGKWIKN
jgi:predicted dehydrogenase